MKEAYDTGVWRVHGKGVGRGTDEPQMAVTRRAGFARLTQRISTASQDISMLWQLRVSTVQYSVLSTPLEVQLHGTFWRLRRRVSICVVLPAYVVS